MLKCIATIGLRILQSFFAHELMKIMAGHLTPGDRHRIAGQAAAPPQGRRDVGCERAPRMPKNPRLAPASLAEPIYVVAGADSTHTAKLARGHGQPRWQSQAALSAAPFAALESRRNFPAPCGAPTLPFLDLEIMFFIKPMSNFISEQ